VALRRRWLERGVPWLAAALLFAGCDRGGALAGLRQLARLYVSADVSGTTLVTADVSGLASSTFILEVSAPDIAPPLVFHPELRNGVASATVSVPAGPSRLLTLHAFDGQGIETHRGSRTIDVEAGSANGPTVIDLVPVSGDVAVVGELEKYRIVASPPELHLQVGDTATLSATVLDARGAPVAPTRPVRWATTRPALAKVSDVGLVTALAAGSGHVAATFNGDVTTVPITIDRSPFWQIMRGVRPRGFGVTPYATSAPASGGRVWHVAITGHDGAAGTAGAPLRTINRAAQLAQAGDVVTIGPGTYDEAVAVKNAGGADRPIVFQAAERGTVVLTGGRHTFQPAAWKPGPQLKGQWYVTLRGLVFRRYSDPLSTENAIAAVRAWRGWVIEDCLFDEAGRTGVEIRDSNVVIARSTFQRSYMNAIIAWGPTNGATSTKDSKYTPITGLRLVDLVIRQNNVTPAPLVGNLAEYVVKLWGTRGTIIDNVESYENFGPGLWLNTRNSDFTIRNSYFHDNRPVPGSTDEAGKGVIVEGNWAPGLIENNVFMSNGGAALSIENSQGIEVRNNLFASNAHCITLVNGTRGFTPTGEPLYPLKDLYIHDNQCRDWGLSGAVAAVRGTFTATPGGMTILFDANRYDLVRNNALARWPGIGPLYKITDVRQRLGWEASGVVAPVTVP